MRKDVIEKAGVAALILLAPGGFVLGLALLAKHRRRRREITADTDERSAR